MKLLYPKYPRQLSKAQLAEKYGEISECLVLLPSGPIRSRLEPCAIGDLRSGRELFEAGKVKVESDFENLDWYIAGHGYATFVDGPYYQNVILFNFSFNRRDYYDSSGLYYESKKVAYPIAYRRVYPYFGYYRNQQGNRYPLSPGMFMNGQ